VVEAMSHGCGGANCAHKAMQDWPALVSKRGVNAVVDKIAVAVGDEDAEDEVGTGAGDGLKLKMQHAECLNNCLWRSKVCRTK